MANDSPLRILLDTTVQISGWNFGRIQSSNRRRITVHAIHAFACASDQQKARRIYKKACGHPGRKQSDLDAAVQLTACVGAGRPRRRRTWPNAANASPLYPAPIIRLRARQHKPTAGVVRSTAHDFLSLPCARATTYNLSFRSHTHTVTRYTFWISPNPSSTQAFAGSVQVTVIMSSYRLETPRARPPPLPLRATHLSVKTSPLPGKETSETLLYSLPSPTRISPSRGLSPNGIPSPSSPLSPRSRTPRGRRMTPPPSSSTYSRSNTPSRPMRSDLEEFAERCRAWYYHQDDNAGRLMTQTLATLPPAQRAPFARLQASIRTAYHASIHARRNAEFKAHLSTTKPGGSLMPHSRADPGGPLAKKERFERLDRFIHTWCTIGMPGTKPFFEGLWAVMRLQVIPEQLGGAGAFRIEWEIDDAVFKEAGGKEFMLDAIDVLKGVLAFEEAPSNRRSPSSNGPAQYSAFSPLSPIHSRSQSQPLPSATERSVPIPPSDPFLDTPTLSSSYSSANTASASTSGSSIADEPITPTTPSADIDDVFAPAQPTLNFSDESDGFLRTWTSPDLPNPELLSLLSIFPAFVARNPLPRFPVEPTSRRPADIEEGEEVLQEGMEIKVGTGTMWLGTKRRADGWQGGWWTRFKLWLARVFC
ncbi:hypothetical protein A0H81_12809 [Grifola frondosa]|uniref:Uncharacterized protein n=1 Tax=Grifola frondosa TaxID=5627 RepID=A0A1C7LQR2_GRIFR|nr:hypothetical protein A0H81_12809 [Grifola frondosa]